MNFQSTFAPPTRIPGVKKPIGLVRKRVKGDTLFTLTEKSNNQEASRGTVNISNANRSETVGIIDSLSQVEKGDGKRSTVVTQPIECTPPKKVQRASEFANISIDRVLEDMLAPLKEVGAQVRELRTRENQTEHLKRDIATANEANKKLEDTIKKLEVELRATKEALLVTKKALAKKEEAFPKDCAKWIKGNPEETVRLLTSTKKEGQITFYYLNRTPLGRANMEAVGTYGYMCGQKAERAGIYELLREDDPEFDPIDCGLPPQFEEEPIEPFQELPRV
ncbi:unnamed protein product [Cuscuta epithymum]|uniref:Uncharacterized protein n=1 Tax=Cuscuta epithymum TaxID=186058 RepID=A0AAV0EHU9_9ASTE|nr:unnamed protein product [Cuscuta epithymum]